MKKTINLVFVVLVFIQPFTPVIHGGRALAPELFGDAGIAFISKYPPVGLVRSGDAAWIILSKSGSGGYPCILIQVAGQRMIDYDASGKTFTRPIKCFIKPLPNSDKFSGWIFFRTHERKFCGAFSGDVPINCMLH